MDIIQQLRGSHWVDASERLRLVNLAVDEIERLRQQKAELVDVLKLALSSHDVVLLSKPPQNAWEAYGVEEKARIAIAKATGGE